jgi:hypothetical protein
MPERFMGDSLKPRNYDNFCPGIVRAQSKRIMTEKRLGQILLSRKVINSQQLEDAIKIQRKVNGAGQKKFFLGEILMFEKFIFEPQLHEALRIQSLLFSLKPRAENLPKRLEPQGDVHWITTSSRKARLHRS